MVGLLAPESIQLSPPELRANWRELVGYALLNEPFVVWCLLFLCAAIHSSLWLLDIYCAYNLFPLKVKHDKVSAAMYEGFCLFCILN